MQLLLLNAVRDVAKTLEELVHSTRIASGKSVSDPAMEMLKTSAKVRLNWYTNIYYRTITEYG